MRNFNKAVVLDRDGTLVTDRGYLSDPAGLEFLPGAEEGLRHLQSLGFGLVVITNQSGVGRGLFSQSRLEAMNERLTNMFKEAGVELAGIYYCPHSPEEHCACRKPGTELILRAAAELRFEIPRSVVVGDKLSDIEMGIRVGARTVLIAGEHAAKSLTQPYAIAKDLSQAALYIATLASGNNGRRMKNGLG